MTVPWESFDEDLALNSYDGALAEAAALVDEYRGRVNDTSTWMLINHVLDAGIGGSALAALFGGSDGSNDAAGSNNGSGWQQIAASLALAGLIFKVVSDEGDLSRQKEGYARGISVIECAVAATKQTNPSPPRLAVSEELTKAEERIRTDILMGALRAVHSSVAASVSNANLGDRRDAGASPGSREEPSNATAKVVAAVDAADAAADAAAKAAAKAAAEAAAAADPDPAVAEAVRTEALAVAADKAAAVATTRRRLEFWNDATNRCLSLLVPDIRPFEVR